MIQRTCATVMLACLLGSPSAVPSRAQTVHEPAAMPPRAFLAEVRRPFRQDGWGRFEGKIVHLRDGEKTKAGLRLDMVFTPERLSAGLLLDGRNRYGIEQVHEVDGRPEVSLAFPEEEHGIRLRDLGIRAADVTFAFIYWSFIEEYAGESVQRHPCRVMDLAHPVNGGRVRVWFSREYFFPLRAAWYLRGEDKPWRTLECKGFKKHDRDLWFIKSMNLRGSGWKTQVVFAEAELHTSKDEPVPPGLLLEVPQPPAEP